MEPQEILKKYFGYDEFRTGQREIIEHILNKQDCLGIMPTGAGKSICYQVPAMCLPGITIVISPLISLMKDQVDSLTQVGIPATFINSSLSDVEYSQTITNIQYNMYKIIYVAPERFYSETFLNIINNIQVSMIAIDEAHCVSQWGHDFRPSYREITGVVSKLSKRPIIASFTATATQNIRDDIIKLLNLENPFVLTTGFDRKNLYFSVESTKDKLEFLVNYLEEHKNNSGIIYCLTRKKVDEIYDFLKSKGYNVSKYHAGMSESERTTSQNDFVFEKTDIIIATNAFGMGIDKSNVRFVIHYNMPSDLESYYQEAGRAGRDGEKAECILLFSKADIVINKFLIEKNSDSDHTNEYQRLNYIVNYCNTSTCLRSYILEYFGEKASYENCDYCSNCNSKMETTDITIDSQKIFSCIKRMNERFGAGLVIDVLKGSKSSKVISMGFDKLSTYGIMKDYDRNSISDLISFYIADGYLKSVGDKYPTLSLTPKALGVLFSGDKVTIKKKINTEVKIVDNLNYNNELFDNLRELRKEIAFEKNVPPFIIFSDVTLKEMSTYFPVTAENMMKITGVGTLKFEDYGQSFINVIKAFIDTNNIKPLDIPRKSKNKNVKSSNSESQTTSKISSKMISYNLFVNENKSIDEIANIRAMSPKTIEEHLLSCFEDGLPINLSNYVNANFESQINDSIKACSSGRLREIKDSLPEEVSYFDIKYYVIKMKGNAS